MKKIILLMSLGIFFFSIAFNITSDVSIEFAHAEGTCCAEEESVCFPDEWNREPDHYFTSQGYCKIKQPSIVSFTFSYK